MRKTILLNLGILLSASLMSCSQISSNSTACGKAGYYGDQTECQNSVSLGTCTSTTVQTDDKNLVCWKSSTTSNQSGNTTGGTTTGGTTGGCSGVAAPWTMGAWSPATCSAGVTTQTRSVTCDSPCGCSATMPSTTQTCTPNMYNGVHYESQCTAKGGTPERIEGNLICRVSGSSCGSGWSQLHYNGATPYTITSAASAQEHTNCVGGRKTVYTGSHSTFTPAKAVETYTYCSSRNCFGCKSYSTIMATVTSVACY